MRGSLSGDDGQRGGNLRRDPDGCGGGSCERTVVSGLVQRRAQLFDRGCLGRGLAAGGHHSQCGQRGATGQHTPPADGSIREPVDDWCCSKHSNILPSERRRYEGRRDVERRDHGVIRDSWRIVGSYAGCCVPAGHWEPPWRRLR